jgi:uncharacterized damage-inducible protein DinB
MKRSGDEKMMHLEPAIRAEWDHFFLTVNEQEDWITPMLLSVEGVNTCEAFWKPGGSAASIADIVLHVTGWLENTLQNVLGLREQENEDWPEPGEPGEESWAEMRSRLRATVADLSRALHNLGLEELYSPPTERKSRRSTMLTNILVHNAYHAGQIVKLRQAFAATEAGGSPVEASLHPVQGA